MFGIHRHKWLPVGVYHFTALVGDRPYIEMDSTCITLKCSVCGSFKTKTLVGSGYLTIEELRK